MKFQIDKKIVTNYIWRIIQIFGREGVTFIILFICARLLSPYDFGIYNYLIALIAFIILFSDFGLSIATTRYIVRYQGEENKENLKGAIYSIQATVFIMFLFITILIMLFGRFIVRDHFNSLLYALPIALLAPLTSIYDGVYRAYGKFKQLALISLIPGILSWVIAYFLISNYKLNGAIITQILFYILSFLCLAFFHQDFSLKFNSKAVKNIFSYALIIGTVNLTYFFFTRINTLILGYFGKILEVGYYEIINKSILIILTFFTIFTQVIAPEITREFYSDKKDNVLTKYKKSMLLIFFIDFIIVLIIYITFPFLLKILFPKYNIPIVILASRILSIGIMTQGAERIASSGFSISTGHGKLNLKILSFFAPVNILVGIIFLKYFGFIGMLTGIVTIQCISDLFFIFYYYKLLKNDCNNVSTVCIAQ